MLAYDDFSRINIVYTLIDYLNRNELPSIYEIDSAIINEFKTEVKGMEA